MSQAKLKHDFVILSMKDIRENVHIGSEGVKMFIQANALIPDHAKVKVDLETGALMLQDIPEEKSEVEPLIN